MFFNTIGAPELKLVCDTRKINNLGWHSKINIDRGLSDTYVWYLENYQ